MGLAAGCVVKDRVELVLRKVVVLDDDFFSYSSPLLDQSSVTVTPSYILKQDLAAETTEKQEPPAACHRSNCGVITHSWTILCAAEGGRGLGLAEREEKPVASYLVVSFPSFQPPSLDWARHLLLFLLLPCNLQPTTPLIALR